MVRLAEKEIKMNKAKDFSDEVRRWFEEYIKNNMRDVLIYIVKSWGAVLTLAQFISILRGMDDPELKWLSNQLERVLREYEDRIKKVQ